MRQIETFVIAALWQNRFIGETRVTRDRRQYQNGTLLRPRITLHFPVLVCGIGTFHGAQIDNL